MVYGILPLLTITSPYVDARVDSNTFIMGNPMPESTLTLRQSRLYPPVRDLEFGLVCTDDLLLPGAFCPSIYLEVDISSGANVSLAQP